MFELFQFNFQYPQFGVDLYLAVELFFFGKSAGGFFNLTLLGCNQFDTCDQVRETFLWAHRGGIRR